MNEYEIDHLIAGADPFGDRSVPAPSAAADLVEELMTTTAPTPEVRRSRRRPILIAVAAAAAIAIAVTGALFPHGNPAAPAPAYAAEARAVAENNPRLLLGDPWKISRVGDFTRSNGKLAFSDGKHEVILTWHPSKLYADTLAELADAGPKQAVTVLNAPATRFQYSGRTEYTTILPVHGSTFVDIRADLGSEAAYQQMMAKIRAVDVDTWLGAMPASAVKPADRAKVVAEVFDGIPVPKGFDRKAFEKGDLSDRYQIGAEVTGHVTCAWLDQWRTGDPARKREARDALATAHSWKILQEMKAEGEYSTVLWEITDKLVQHNQAAQDYQQALGC
ncbi:hypothetical protein AB0E69_06770 [Kribbella sp. NPDC026611]|uniref:hypothetical protein n=1 Tax=Kribbella sp. NPDC026611 TaxID=3154911 RepID=UPI0033ED1938